MKKILGSILTLSIILNATENNIISFASGPEGGTYYQVAKDIANVCSHGVLKRLRIVKTNGSMENIDKLLNNKNTLFAIVQEDVLFHLLEKNPVAASRIKVVFPLYYEAIHLITLKEKNISSISDLKHKRIIIGPHNSGSAVTGKFILSFLDNGLAVEIMNKDYEESLQYLKKKKVDAILIVGGVPLPFLLRENASSPLALSNAIYKMRELEYYNYPPITIKKKSYPWLNNDTKTRGVLALVVTKNSKSKRERKIIKAFYQCVTKHINLFKRKAGKSYHWQWKEVNFTIKTKWPRYEE